MAMTLFSMPKPFRGHIGVIQRNAIRSWTLLRPACEILLLGDDDGVAAAAEEFGVRRVPDISRNSHGTPLVSDMFAKAQQAASHRLLCYVNADIVLLDDLLPALAAVSTPRFLLFGQRWDLDVREGLDFEDPEWQKRLLADMRVRGKLHGHTGVDFYVFPAGLFGEIPPFALGRYWYDTWLIWKARSLRVPVIDATPVITSIHQNHERTYSSLGKSPVGANDDYVHGVEAQRNEELAGGRAHRYTLRDATWMLTPEGLRRARSLWHLTGRLRTLVRHAAALAGR